MIGRPIFEMSPTGIFQWLIHWPSGVESVDQLGIFGRPVHAISARIN